MSWLAEFRALDGRVWSLAAARLVVTAGFAMVLPLLSMHLAIDRGIPAVTVGLIWTVAGAVGALTQWAAGELVDRIGRKRVLIAALLARSALLVALGYAINWNHQKGAPVLVIAACIVGNSALRAFFDPVASALVADLSAPEQRVAAFALQREGINIGWALGNASGALASTFSYGTLFYFASPFTLVSALVLLRLQEPAGTATRRPLCLPDLLAFLQDQRFVRFLAATLAFYVLQIQLSQSLSIYGARVLHLGRAEVASLYTLNGLLVVVLQLPVVAHIRKLGTRGALVGGCLGYAASYALVGLAQGHRSLLLCVACVTLAEIFTSPAQQTAVTTMAPPGRIGAYSGLYGTVQVIGQSVGPLIGTGLLDSVPARTAWLFLAGFGVAAAIGYRSKGAAST